MSNLSDSKQTEHIDDNLLDLDLRDNASILKTLVESQVRGVKAASHAITFLDKAVTAAAERLRPGNGRLVMIGAGASGRIAVQDGAELWPTYGWPASRLLLSIAGGEASLLKSVEGCEDDAENAHLEVELHCIGENDVVLGLAASGKSPWTVAWIKQARDAGALTIGMANNENTPLLLQSEWPVYLNSGVEVLAGSTRMAAGTAQKVALNMFSTLLMIRLNRTHGNLMVDMAAINAKLDDRRLRMLNTLVPNADTATAKDALRQANGWVKLAALICMGATHAHGVQLLEDCHGSLRSAINELAE